MDKDWAALAAAINARLSELGMTQQDLARVSRVSAAKVRELQRNYEPHRANLRTLAALSEGLGWPSDRLERVLEGTAPEELGSASVADGLARLRAEVSDLRDRVEVIEQAERRR